MIDSIRLLNDTCMHDASEKIIISDMSHTIYTLIEEANRGKYLPSCKSYQLFDEDDTDCYGVNPDKHHDVSQECIENYIWLIYNNTQMERECLIPTIMYLKKLLDSQQDCFASKLRIYSRNWKTVVGMSMLIAAKVWDDFHMDVGSAVQFLYCMDLQRCNKLEVLYLKMIDFNVSIKKVAFCDYEEDISVRHSFRSRLSTPRSEVRKQDEGALTRDGSEATMKISATNSYPTLHSLLSDVDEDCGLLCSADQYDDGNANSPDVSDSGWRKNIEKSNSFCRKNRVHIAPSSPSSFGRNSPDSWSQGSVAPSSSSSPPSSSSFSSGVMTKLSNVVKSALPFVRYGSAKIC